MRKEEEIKADAYRVMVELGSCYASMKIAERDLGEIMKRYDAINQEMAEFQKANLAVGGDKKDGSNNESK